MLYDIMCGQNLNEILLHLKETWLFCAVVQRRLSVPFESCGDESQCECTSSAKVDKYLYQEQNTQMNQEGLEINLKTSSYFVHKRSFLCVSFDRWYILI